MALSEPRRRVSYTLPPPPSHSSHTFVLPPPGISKLGHSSPLLSYAKVRSPTGPRNRSHSQSTSTTPRHRLGVTSLALDTTTLLQGHGSPNGILYSGGRDGMVIAWDLGLSMREKISSDDPTTHRNRKDKWELITGWANDGSDEEDEENDAISGDILGDVTRNRQRRGSEARSQIQKQSWQLDGVPDSSIPTTRFRQSAQAHMAWINDIKLCNQSQTVISASSDGTVKAWSPHHTNAGGPARIGQHSDYVRCLSVCQAQNWVASGSFDKTIKLWDSSRAWGGSAAAQEPLSVLSSPEAENTSIYALAADEVGSVIVSGGPDRIVRLWDPRAGLSGRSGRTGKLVGHTDNIRSILISEDSRYVILTASSDASIKLWSLATQRCLHTFTVHTESVWALWSEDPSLEIFYSGDKSGAVCRIDVKSELYDVGDGECVVLCRDKSEPVNRCSTPTGISSIVTFDDAYLWTASGEHSDVKKWRIPRIKGDRAAEAGLPRLGATGAVEDSEGWIPHSRRTQTPSIRSISSNTQVSDQQSFAQNSGTNFSGTQWENDVQFLGVPYHNLVRLGEPVAVYNEEPAGRPGFPGSMSGFGFPGTTSIPQRTASIKSLSSLVSPQGNIPSPTPVRPGGPGHNVSSSSHVKPSSPPQLTPKEAYHLRDISTTATAYCDSGPVEVIHGDYGLVRATLLNDRVHALSVDSVGNVGVWDILRGSWKGYFPSDEVRALLDPHPYSPREALEVIRNRIEGEAVVSSWCTIDTKMGVLTVYIAERGCFDAEIYADEVGFKPEKVPSDEYKINLGKTVLKGLFHGFIREELRLHSHRQQSGRDRTESTSSSGSAAPLPPQLRRGSNPGSIELDPVAPMMRARSRSSPKSPRSPPSSPVTNAQNITPAVSVAPPLGSSRASPLITPLIPLLPVKDGTTLPSIPQSPGATSDDGVTPSVDDTLPSSVAPIRRLRSATLDSQHQSSASEGSPADYFSARSRQPSNNPTTPGEDTVASGKDTPVTPGGFMGRLKNLGKKPGASNTTRPSDTAITPTATPTVENSENAEDMATPGPATRTVIQSILSSQPLTPPSSSEVPSLGLSSRVAVMIAEESEPEYEIIYRGGVSSSQQQHDITLLEETIPQWLMEFLLLNKMPSSYIAPSKMSFVMCPYILKEGEEGEQLPELLNTLQSKLTASKTLRVRKLAVHVQDKLEKISSKPSSPTVDSFPEREARRARPKAEDLYEILCADVLLPLDMNLAQIRQYVWKQSSELVLHYRKKVVMGTAL